MSEWVVMSEQCESIVLCVTALLTLLLTSSAKNLTLEGTGFLLVWRGVCIIQLK